MPSPATTNSPRALPAQLGFWGSLCLACGAALLIAWNTAIPLGIPGEWVWPRIESAESLAWR